MISFQNYEKKYPENEQHNPLITIMLSINSQKWIIATKEECGAYGLNCLLIITIVN